MDRLIAQLPTLDLTPIDQPTQGAQDMQVLGETVVAAMQRAMETAAFSIASGYARGIEPGDEELLLRATLSAWEATVLEIIRDTACPQSLRARAVQVHLAGRSHIEPIAHQLVRSFLQLGD